MLPAPEVSAESVFQADDEASAPPISFVASRIVARPLFIRIATAHP